MGDIKKNRKSYSPPSHPWRKLRIDSENKLSQEYGLRRKREIWKVEAKLRKFRKQARKLVGMGAEQAEEDTKNLVSKLVLLGVLDPKASLEDVLALGIDDFLGRRLQTIIYKKGIANTPLQARQIIRHGHITIRGKRQTTLSILISLEDENEIKYIGPPLKLSTAKPPKPVAESKEEAKGEKEEKPEAVKEKTPEAKKEEKPEAPKEDTKEEKSEKPEEKQEAKK